MFLVVLIGLAAMCGAIGTVLDQSNGHSDSRDRLSLSLMAVTALVMVTGLIVAIAHLL